MLRLPEYLKNSHWTHTILMVLLVAGGGYAAPQEFSDQPQGKIEYDKIFQIDDHWKQLGDANPIWIDRDGHQVIVGGQICLTAGMLEMFACPRGTREHESIVSVHVPSRIVHAALLAVGAKPGAPVQFDPEYKPASGAKVQIDVRWMADGKLVERRAQDMMREVRTKNPVAQDWVFGGSLRWKDEATGTEYYSADGGELVCVSNFGNATLDLPISSSAANSSLLFEANPDNIPPLGTPVLMVLKPEVPADDQRKTESSAKSDGAKPEVTKPDVTKPDGANPNESKPSQPSAPETPSAGDGGKDGVSPH